MSVAEAQESGMGNFTFEQEVDRSERELRRLARVHKVNEADVMKRYWIELSLVRLTKGRDISEELTAFKTVRAWIWQHTNGREV